MKQVVALRHLAFEDLGSFAEVLLERGFTLDYVDVGVDGLNTLDPCAADLWVVLGGPIGACDEADYPYLRDELALLEQRLQADLPTLGICLGAQLMARALGARVYPGPAKEIGWAPLTLTDAGHTSAVAPLDGAETSMLHWHGDTFELPEGAKRLASTGVCANQVFSWGERVLAFQCHPEVKTAQMERWLIGHTAELAAEGLSVTDLRAQNQALGPVLERQGQRFFAEWLEQVGL